MMSIALYLVKSLQYRVYRCISFVFPLSPMLSAYADRCTNPRWLAFVQRRFLYSFFLDRLGSQASKLHARYVFLILFRSKNFKNSVWAKNHRFWAIFL